MTETRGHHLPTLGAVRSAGDWDRGDLQVRSAGDWDRGNLQVMGGLLGATRPRMALEEDGAAVAALALGGLALGGVAARSGIIPRCSATSSRRSFRRPPRSSASLEPSLGE
jgi:hypothetical protein